MGNFRRGWVFLCLIGTAFCPSALVAAGPDVIVGDLYGVGAPPLVFRWGRVGDITAYSVGTNSCNIGDQPLEWVATTNQHPVIAQNLYRLKNGRFEQIGQSWLKHGFVATNDSLCDTCTNPVADDQLHPGCSDPYDPVLNGNHMLLGPRSGVNASTGYFVYGTSPPESPTVIERRLQVHDADLDPDLNAGALYFVEGHYVASDDAAAGNDNNNASYRVVTVTEMNPPSTTFNLNVMGTTQREKAGIQAWQDMDATVAVSPVDVPGDGRVIVAAKATNLQNGFWQYEYAVQNLNSDRSVGGFRVALHDATPVQAAGFHDVDSHSGEPYDLTDWPSARPPGELVWATTPYSVNANANALRWGTLYNFRFRCTSPPIPNAVITLELFKPGSPSSATVMTLGPSPLPRDCNGNLTPDYLEIQGNPSLDCDTNGNLDECDLDCDGNDVPDACDITANPLLDCNGDGRLDDCEIVVGSPAPGGPFYCMTGCDPDCNSNGIPDSCDIDSLFDPDCNGNGVPDSCDLAGSASEDCNSNGRPDECEIPVGSPAPGGPYYCTSGCDADCNSNGVPDSCDIGVMEDDCDGNMIPDGCDIEANPSLDCNSNGIIDTCGETDCNSNNIPDGCEYPACTGILRGDYDCSATVDTDDLQDFLEEILRGIPSCLCDLNADGAANGRDIQGFVNAM